MGTSSNCVLMSLPTQRKRRITRLAYPGHLLVAQFLVDSHSIDRNGLRHKRRPPPRPILARVEAFAAEGMDDERFRFPVQALLLGGEGGPYFEAAGLPAAAERSAASSIGGSAFPRFSARRRIPAHAFPLKKYLAGVEVSSTCHNEHTLASLGQTEPLGAEDSPRRISDGSAHTTSVRPSSPWRDQRRILSGKSSKDAAEGIVLGAEDSGDILPDDDAGAKSQSSASAVNGVCESAECEGKVSALIVQ